ncbi:MAG: hypothetical protein WCF78_04590 [archaeon]
MNSEILSRLPSWMQDIIKLDEEAKKHNQKPKDETIAICMTEGCDANKEIK